MCLRIKFFCRRLDSCEKSKRPCGFVKGERFLDKPSDYQLSKNVSALWHSIVCGHKTTIFI